VVPDNHDAGDALERVNADQTLLGLSHAGVADK
jgi:hypothetical protein